MRFTDATVLRLFLMAAATIVMIVAGSLGKFAVKQNAQWVVALGGLVVSGMMVAAAFNLFLQGWYN
jgi:hypothetical protein